MVALFSEREAERRGRLITYRAFLRESLPLYASPSRQQDATCEQCAYPLDYWLVPVLHLLVLRHAILDNLAAVPHVAEVAVA
jgi:hypothetical protein